MPKKSFGRTPDEDNGVYDPEDYDATGNYRGSGEDPYADEDLRDQEDNPNSGITDRGGDDEARQLENRDGDSSNNGGDRPKRNLGIRRPTGPDEDNHAQLFNPKGDQGGTANKALGLAAKEAGPAGAAIKMATKVIGRGKKGRGAVVGFAMILAMIGGVAGINNYANHFITHVAEVFDKEVGKVAKHEEQKVSRTLLQRMVNRALARANASAAEKTQADEEAKKAKAEGRSVAEVANSAVIAESNLLQQLIKDADLELKFNANGELSGIVDRTGADVGEQLAKDSPSVRDLIEKEWDVSKLYSQRTNFTFHGGTSLNVFPPDGSQDKNAKKTISQAIENGAGAEQIALAESEQKKNVPPDADEATKNAINDTEQKSQIIKEVTEAADKNFNETFDAEAATDAGVKAGLKSINKIGNSLTIAGIATTACTVKESFQIAADKRVPKLITLLMRNYGTLKSLSSELNAGKLSSRTVNAVSLLYFGNKGLFPNKNGTPKEASYPVTRSAAWHRASNVTVDSNPKSPYYTPDIKPGVVPTKTGATKFVDTIQKLLNASGLEFACDALTSKGGLLAQTGLTAIQVVANIGTFGAAQAAILAGGVAFNIALETEILPAIPSLFGTLGATGTNAAVDNGNNDEVGGNLAMKDYARSTLGAVPVSDKVSKQANDVADADILRDKQNQSLAYRTFATSNVDSLLSRLIMRIPLDTQASIASMGSYFANFPFTILHTLSTVFAPPSLHAASDKCTSDPHCITGYVLSDTKIDKYGSEENFVKNEDYLFGTVNYGGKTVKRIDALGNPNTYSPSPSGDSSTDDLLHCFVNSHEQLASASDGSNDAAKANCGTMGTYDMTAETPKPPDDTTVAGIYCKALGSSKDDSGCMSSVKGQMDHDFDRYCVYQAFSTVARTFDYASEITK